MHRALITTILVPIERDIVPMPRTILECIREGRRVGDRRKIEFPRFKKPF